MASNMLDLFKMIIIVQMLFGASITILAYALPDNTLNYVTSFSELAGDIDINSINTDIQDSVDSQLDIPVVELGALIFYSGNIIIDLIINSLYAIPEMIGLVINGFCMLFSFDPYIVNIVELLSAAMITALYFLGIIQLLTNIRSQGQII